MKPKVEKDDKLPRIENKNMNLSYMIPDKGIFVHFRTERK